MHAQEVAQEVLAPQEHASGEKRVKLRFIRKKFQTQEDQNPIRKKPQEVTSPTASFFPAISVLQHSFETKYTSLSFGEVFDCRCKDL